MSDKKSGLGKKFILSAGTRFYQLTYCIFKKGYSLFNLLPEVIIRLEYLATEGGYIIVLLKAHLIITKQCQIFSFPSQMV
jgi:hypothetical protein